MSQQKEWVTYNPQTATYDTPDGTSVPAEIVDNCWCLADVLRVCQLRTEQRAAQQSKGEAL
ncbi:MAG TPA: hypothetical protein VFM33_10065 [Aquabacterium sp.]|nr:hypothetical protein [Aquabacterium sp.]